MREMRGNYRLNRRKGEKWHKSYYFFMDDLFIDLMATLPVRAKQINKICNDERKEEEERGT